MTPPKTKDWNALDNRMPPKPELTVTGYVETQGGGYEPVLTEASPQGINPKILILKLTIENKGAGDDSIDYRRAEFKKATTNIEYSQVDIHWKGSSIALIDVETVH